MMLANLDIDRFALNEPTRLGELVVHCRKMLQRDGMFNLDMLVRSEVVDQTVKRLQPLFAREAFTHARTHNIYFLPEVPDLAPEHPALTPFETVNHTLCADQLGDCALLDIYQWPPLMAFLAAVMDKERLYPMADPLARVNVMQYREGEALNWHFDRSEFTTTLLLQDADTGGEFQYMTGLRSDDDPNYEGVGAFLGGDQSEARTLLLRPGTLNVFRGRNTAHRVSPVVGKRDRIVAVFSYYDRPDVTFSAEERLGFYGRTE